MEPQASPPAHPSSSNQVELRNLAILAEAVRQALIDEREGCGAQVTSGDSSSADLWADMPTVDSKTVARIAPVFKGHTGKLLNPKRIRPGGYASIEDAVQHLVYGVEGSK